MLKATFLFSFYALLILVISSCQKEESLAGGPQLQITFSHTTDGNTFALNTPYINHFGEPYTVSKFKYYITNIALLKGNQTELIPDTYLLIDEASAPSKEIYLPIAEGAYDGISFLIGVDSARNVSGAQTGALDPAQDMFWTWNSGYIMAKLEGQSSTSTAPNNRIEYHIGGFKGENNTVRKVVFPFTVSFSVTGKQVIKINIEAEIQKWFDGVHPLRIAQNPVTMTPGLLSKQFADNYTSMFYLKAAGVQ